MYRKVKIKIPMGSRAVSEVEFNHIIRVKAESMSNKDNDRQCPLNQCSHSQKNL